MSGFHPDIIIFQNFLQTIREYLILGAKRPVPGKGISANLREDQFMWVGPEVTSGLAWLTGYEAWTADNLPLSGLSLTSPYDSYIRKLSMKFGLGFLSKN
jgi:hypothetical protein